ncbi:carboxylesterase family protein [Deinococcus sp. KSM4-11]|uniref:carboxylesterase/lipase family protein n=1 Tax=Deinococcus sp. KSM4-11 TaxID=2568654 RepID=UPI0010A362AE|nr:carboxylesterase family protein [Deinococcus sp. KSM4-11]THF87230.1 carboxylesterase family protein [Deinococcus sp. KSM4-11]
MNFSPGLRHVLIAASLTLSAASAQTVTVPTDQGPVIGSVGTFQQFMGIPYAAPPTGANRWKAPQPAPTWTTPRDARTPGNICPQVVIALFPVPGRTPGEILGNEDCLFLNVYAPKGSTAASKRPVMVWLHGGSFVAGAGSSYDASVLAQKNDIVVVTLNYRLGALGFLALPALDAEAQGGASGNYGLLDQQAALKWVQRNIVAFGGDPAHVTVAGESAGGMSVCAQLASPQAAGLFQQAIIQSGLCTSPGNAVLQKDAAARNVKYADKLGCRSDDLACLRRADVASVLTTKVPGLRPISNLVWSPTYGTPLLPLPLHDAFAQGKFNRVPVMAGTNHDEGRLFVPVASPDGSPVSLVKYWASAGLLVGTPRAQRVLLQYPFRRYGTPALAFATMFTDGVFSCPAIRVDNALSKYVPLYAYEFNDPQAVSVIKSPSDLPGLGSYHSSSLVYAFQTPLAGVADSGAFSPAQRALSDAFSGAWANFVKTGTPNASGATTWQVFDPAHANVQVFTPTSVRESTNFTTDHKCAFWLALDVK